MRVTVAAHDARGMFRRKMRALARAPRPSSALCWRLLCPGARRTGHLGAVPGVYPGRVETGAASGSSASGPSPPGQ